MKLEKKDVDVYDLIVVAVDNIGARMHLNFIYKQSKCRELIDCGISGEKVHVCRINKNSYCLYCIKELYEVTKEVNICSLRYQDTKITEENRNKILRSYVYLHKDTQDINKMIEIFNKLVKDKRLYVSCEEIYEIYYNIIPSVCYINSICSSLIFYLIEDESCNFIFYNGKEGIYFSKLKMERNPSCILCKTY